MNKRVLVTGASRGIGRAIALMLCGKGFSVVGTTRSPERLSDDLKDHPALKFVGMDVTDIGAVPEGVSKAAKILGGIDTLVNNAGISHIGPFEEIGDDQARKIMMTDFFGAGAVMRAVIPMMRKAGGGLIINVTSLAGRIGLPYQSYYCAAKFALEGLSESLRLELASQGIRVVIVEPGNIRTDIGEHRLLCETKSPHYKKGYAAACEVINRTVEEAGPPEGVARVVLRVIRARRPALRYPAGKGALSTMLLLGLFPQRIVERIMVRYYGLDR